MSDRITIRHSTLDDVEAIREIAALDSARAPEGAAMLAFVGDELRAVVPLGGGRAVADPFHPTAELVELLRLAVHGSRPARGGALRSAPSLRALLPWRGQRRPAAPAGSYTGAASGL